MSIKLLENRRVVSFYVVMALSVIAFLNSFVANANAGIPILIKGKVTDVFTGTPTKLEMVFVDEVGSKIKCVPNIIDGHYEQVLISGKSYTVYFVNFDVAREIYSVNIPEFDNYQEYNKDWQVKKLAVGNSIYYENAFIQGTAELSPDGIVMLKQLSNILKFNRGAKFDLIISCSKAESKNTKLLQDRIDAVNKLPELSKYKNKINVISQQQGDFNFNLKVREIVDPLN